MSFKRWIPLGLALVLGLVAAIVARNMLSQPHVTAPQAMKLVKVVVAHADLPPGQEIRAEDVMVGQVSPDAVPTGSFTDAQAVVGRVTDTQMVKGQPVLEAQLAPQGAGVGLQAMVPDGMRAITIEVNEFSGVAGLLLPGCHVDVLATIQSDNKPVTRAIVQDVKVTAVGQRLTAQPPQAQDPNSPPQMTRSVTMLVTLKQAEAIELAATTGRPRLVLRSARDQTISNNSGVTLGELCGNDNKPPAAPEVAKATAPIAQPDDIFASRPPATQPAAQKYTVRVFRAGAMSTVALDASGTHGTPEASEQSGLEYITGH